MQPQTESLRPDSDSVLAYIEDMLSNLAEMAEAHGEFKLASGLWMASVETAQARKALRPG